MVVSPPQVVGRSRGLWAGLATCPLGTTEGLQDARETCGRSSWLGQETGHNSRETGHNSRETGHNKPGSNPAP